MRAKPAFLRLARAVLGEIIQPRLAQRHYFRMFCQFDQFVGGNAVFLIGMMRMGADRAIDVRKTRRDRQQLVEALHPGGDRDDTPYSGGFGACDDTAQDAREVLKIEMAVAVDEHLLTPPKARRNSERPAPAQVKRPLP